jgi:hypothetical protein
MIRGNNPKIRKERTPVLTDTKVYGITTKKPNLMKPRLIKIKESGDAAKKKTLNQLAFSVT